METGSLYIQRIFKNPDLVISCFWGTTKNESRCIFKSCKSRLFLQIHTFQPDMMTAHLQNTRKNLKLAHLQNSEQCIRVSPKKITHMAYIQKNGHGTVYLKKCTGISYVYFWKIAVAANGTYCTKCQRKFSPLIWIATYLSEIVKSLELSHLSGILTISFLMSLTVAISPNVVFFEM